MSKTVVGIYDNPEAARKAVDEVMHRGIDRGAIQVRSQEILAGRNQEDHDSFLTALRAFLSEIFGTRPPEETAHYSDTLRRGGALVAVRLADDADPVPARLGLAAAGAIDIDERLERDMGHGPITDEDRDAFAMHSLDLQDLAGGVGEHVPGPRPYEEYEPDYRRDYHTHYGSQGGDYEDYAPAYRYGHALAGDPRYQGRGWEAIEPEARRDWVGSYPEGSWDRFNAAIRFGWERAGRRR